MVILLSYTGTSHTGSHLILTTDDSSLRGYSYPCSWKKWGSERLSKWPKETQHGQHPGSPGFQTPCSFLCCGFDSAIVFAMSSPAGVSVGVLLFRVCACLLDGSIWACLSFLKGAGCSQASQSRPAQSLLLTNEKKGERAKAPASCPLFPKPAPVPTQEAASPRCWGLARGRGRQVTLPAKCPSALLVMNVEWDLSVVLGQGSFPCPMNALPLLRPPARVAGRDGSPPSLHPPQVQGTSWGLHSGAVNLWAQHRFPNHLVGWSIFLESGMTWNYREIHLQMIEALVGWGPAKVPGQRKLGLRWEGRCHPLLGWDPEKGTLLTSRVFGWGGAAVFHLCLQLPWKPLLNDTLKPPGCLRTSALMGPWGTCVFRLPESERRAGWAEQGSWIGGRAGFCMSG